MKRTSCGIVIVHAGGELLLCHATGSNNWDIPKGGGEAGESPVQTAIRETVEECGLSFESGQLLELGRFGYRPDKDLHLFAVLVERLDVSILHCVSTYRDYRGRLRPEMDDFAWVPFDQVPHRCARNMTRLLTQTLLLPDLLQRLQARGVAALRF